MVGGLPTRGCRGKPGHPFPDQIMYTTCLYGRRFCSPVYLPDRRGADELRINSHIWLLMEQKTFFELLRIKLKMVLLPGLGIKYTSEHCGNTLF